MNRPIKFRAWGGEKMLFWELLDTWCNDYVRATKLPIMQFTGLSDKNGKEIYEGDIIKVDNQGTYDTRFVDGSFGLYLLKSKNGWVLNLCHSHEVMKIIGNIYENPELISS